MSGRFNPLSLGVRLRNVTGLESRRRRFGAGEIERDRDRPREEWWDMYESVGDLLRERERERERGCFRLEEF